MPALLLFFLAELRYQYSRIYCQAAANGET